MDSAAAEMTEQLGKPPAEFGEAGRETRRLSEDAARDLTRSGEGVAAANAKLLESSEALSKAAAEAERQAVYLRESDVESRRDHFLHSATAMIDDLNAAAVNLNRLLEQDIPDDVWNRYRRGDRSIFARRLIRSRDGFLVHELRRRFETDEVFRGQAMRYLNQFDRLMAQAAACDPEHILSAAFLTADVGKLYLVLSRSLGREPAATQRAS